MSWVRWVFFIVLVVSGIAAIAIDQNWVGGLILIGIGLFPILFVTGKT